MKGPNVAMLFERKRWLFPKRSHYKNMPEDLYEKLKSTANANRGSIDEELLFRLERSLVSRKVSVEERIKRARKLREGVAEGIIDSKDISKAIDEGRP